MHRSTLVLGGMVLVAAALIVLDRPEPTPPTAVAPGIAGPAPSAALPDGHPPLNPAAPVTGSAGVLATVLETLDSGGYTYARVETEGEEIWVAGPPTPLEIGAEVTLAGAMGMENFTAASLDRTFDRILFVGAFGGATPGGLAGAVSPRGPAADSPAAGSGTVAEVSHAAGYSYLRIDTDEGELWLAGNQIEIAQGETVSWSGGAVMQNFNSPSLGRTFDRILFAEGLRPGG
ncbi:MAG: hypothetical protein HKN71_13445 [Gemmatimonadetes bacterium]|nr:hypothetical protein [Gemmatimonadota bacterium]